MWFGVLAFEVDDAPGEVAAGLDGLVRSRN